MPVRRNDPETIREEGVNVLLAHLLSERGVSARPERRSKGGAPDVRVELRTGDLVLLECKWEGSTALLENQLDERMEGFREALGTIGVLYPGRLRRADDTRVELEAATDLQWWVHGSRGAKTRGSSVRTGSAAELADQLRTLPLELEGVDRVVAAASAVGYALEETANAIDSHARISRRIADIIASTDQEKNRAAALRIGCLVLFNALAFQDRLAASSEDVETVAEALGEGVGGLRRVWRYVCENIDYVPVFELAADILDVIDDGPDELKSQAITPLVRAVTETRRVEGHDLSGRLFHTLLTDAKFTGAYYTSVPAATLLARLVFHNWPADVDWADHEFPASLNVALIERDFVLDTVIVSHDPLRWNFSDSTDLSEALLIATRRPEGDQAAEHRTTFVNLWQNPDGVLDAHRLAQAVTTTPLARLEETGAALLEVDGRHVGEMVSVAESTFIGKKWLGVQFARADLIRSAVRLLDDGEVWVPKGGQRLGYGLHLWQQSGRLLIAERLRLDTGRVVAMRSETRVLSNVWWPVRIEEARFEKALAAWLNSSLGLLTITAQRTSTEGGWVAMKKADLQELPVLDLRRLAPMHLQGLSELFDRLSEAEFERLPGMGGCPARRALDDGVSKILGLPDLGKLRELLASEPVVSNRRL